MPHYSQDAQCRYVSQMQGTPNNSTQNDNPSTGQVGTVQHVSSGSDLEAACAAAAASTGIVLLDATDWRIIPVENLVAAFQACQAGSWVCSTGLHGEDMHMHACIS